jgi:hypothetical protein
MPTTGFHLGMLKLLQNSLDAFEAKKAAEAVAPGSQPERPVLVPVRRPLAPAGAMVRATGPRSPQA